jgi:probable HAF family extracellular repeat protein
MRNCNRTAWSLRASRWLWCLSLAIVCQAAFAQAMYRIKPLTFPGGCRPSSPYGMSPEAYSLNDAGQVTGGACNAQGQEHAFLRQPGGRMLDLGPSETGSTSVGQAISPNGRVAGTASDSTGKFSFLWSGAGQPMKRIYGGLGGRDAWVAGVNDHGQFVGSATLPLNKGEHAFAWMNDGKPMIDLGTFGGSYSSAFGITATGLVAGNADVSSDGTPHAFVWKNDGASIRDLGTLGGDFSYATGVNASGQIVGGSNTTSGGKPHAFLWRNDGTPMRDLGTLNGDYSYALAVNALGQVAGQANPRPGVNATHAFVWMNDGKPMRDIGSIGGESTSPHSINFSGQVVGEGNPPGNTTVHVFLWRHDGTKMQDVNDLIDPMDPLQPYVTLTQAPLINDHGNILAYGEDRRTGQYSAYLLQGTVLVLAPRSLAFGNQPIGTASAAKPVTVTNTSPKATAIASITLNGSAPGQFAYADDCGSALAGHATCTINVTFRPTSNGAKSAFLKVNGGGGGLRSVTLTGNGT